jgi:phage terminase Nu1 subunit (DNA packaging protein)
MEQQQQDEGIRISAGRGKARNEQKANHLRGKNNAIQQGRREDNVDELPRLKISGLVLVEGKFDARAVKKAVLVPEVVALQDWVRCPMLTWAPKL